MSCSVKQDPNELRKQTAETTTALKTDAKAIAQGVREGLGHGSRVDVNSASIGELSALPGVTANTARRIVANRPYDKPESLVEKHVVSRQEYQRIADQIAAKK